MKQKMIIYDTPAGPYPARVRIALAEKNMLSSVQFVRINLWKGKHKKPEFLAKNYSGTVPVLELDDGTLIAECTAITEYIDALDGTPTLTGKTPLEKGVIHMMNKRAELELLDPVSVIFTMLHLDWGLKSSFTKTKSGDFASATKPYMECIILIPFSENAHMLLVIHSQWLTSQ